MWLGCDGSHTLPPWDTFKVTLPMRGVDLLDSCTAKYKFPIKSRLWYIFWHIIILAVVNAWLLCKRDCKAIQKSSKETLNRRQFQVQLASSLILVNITAISNARTTLTSGCPLSPDLTNPVTSPIHIDTLMAEASMQRLQSLAQGHFNMQLRGAWIWTSDHPITRQPALPPELQLPKDVMQRLKMAKVDKERC